MTSLTLFSWQIVFLLHEHVQTDGGKVRLLTVTFVLVDLCPSTPQVIWSHKIKVSGRNPVCCRLKNINKSAHRLKYCFIDLWPLWIYNHVCFFTFKAKNKLASRDLMIGVSWPTHGPEHNFGKHLFAWRVILTQRQQQGYITAHPCLCVFMNQPLGGARVTLKMSRKSSPKTFSWHLAGVVLIYP